MEPNAVTARWLLSILAVFLVTLIFYTGAQYNRLGNIETTVNELKVSMQALNEINEMKVQIKYNADELERQSSRLDNLKKAIQ